MTAKEQHPNTAWQRRPWWRRLRLGDRDRAARREVARRLYVALVNQARTPALFAGLGVPDTPEGRFEVIGLHAALVLRRLKAEGRAGQALGQELFDLMFADMDMNLRELGVGDLSVGKYVKRLARNLYARIAALEQALDQGDATVLGPMLKANVYRGGAAPEAAQVTALEGYLVAAAAALAAQPGDALLRGEIAFPEPVVPPAS